MQVLIQGNCKLHAKSQSRQVKNVRVLDRVSFLHFFLKHLGPIDRNWLSNVTTAASEEFHLPLLEIEDSLNLSSEQGLLLLWRQDCLFLRAHLNQVFPDCCSLLANPPSLLLGLISFDNCHALTILRLVQTFQHIFKIFIITD